MGLPIDLSFMTGNGPGEDWHLRYDFAQATLVRLVASGGSGSNNLSVGYSLLGSSFTDLGFSLDSYSDNPAATPWIPIPSEMKTEVYLKFRILSGDPPNTASLQVL